MQLTWSSHIDKLIEMKKIKKAKPKKAQPVNKVKEIEWKILKRLNVLETAFDLQDRIIAKQRQLIQLFGV